MTERVLILGANGMLGRAWQELLHREGVAFDALSRAECDLADTTSLNRLDRFLRQSSSSSQSESSVGGRCWSHIINCAAYTQVDKAEIEVAQAERINGQAVGQLALFAKKVGARLVHYSTDYVFDGCATAPYQVNAAVSPINAYGQSKLLGEQALQASDTEFLLIRTSWVYAPWGSNFVSTMSRLMLARSELRVVADQMGRPSSAQQLAARTWALCQRACRGVYHLTDGGQCSWYEFALAIRDELCLDTKLFEITTAEYPTAAKRPQYSVLSTERADALLGVASPWTQALSEVIRTVRATAGLAGAPR